MHCLGPFSLSLLKCLHWTRLKKIYIFCMTPKNQQYHTKIPKSNLVQLLLSELGLPGKCNQFPQKSKTAFDNMHKGETRGSRPIQSMAKYFRFCWQFMACHQHTQEYHQNILRDLYRQFMACHQHTVIYHFPSHLAPTLLRHFPIPPCSTVTPTFLTFSHPTLLWRCSDISDIFLS